MKNMEQHNQEIHCFRVAERNIIGVWIFLLTLSAGLSLAAMYALYAAGKWLLAHS